MIWKWVITGFVISVLGIGLGALASSGLGKQLLPSQRFSLPPSAILNSENVTSPTGENADATAIPPLTNIQQIFDTTSKPTTKNKDTVTVLVTGDVLTARTVNSKMVGMNDFTWPFQKTKELLNAADITLINLETPIIEGCPTRVDGMLFCGNLKNMEGLHYAGVDVVTIANNHAGNQGAEGVIETQKTLQDAGFLVTGVTEPAYKKIGDITFGFVGLNDVDRQVGVLHADNPTVVAQISEARKRSDVVIVEFHWGEEYRYTPTERQKELARLSIDNGADLVVGNHPHWFQPIEFYKGKLIAYSHGNFVFDQMWSRETREGIVGKYTFAGKNLVGVEYVPILIEDYGQPRILEGAEANKILDTLQSESEKLLQNQQ